ncbi:hypothetical protein GHT09_004172 [Marmota monax]|uniref:Uncharacterized protein n=1 Tax=Marmota monax TaxID=9995 RepID=A0A834QUF7_MARMO|nr:hypothetical protein GHT09_004172 [Marmota monax]
MALRESSALTRVEKEAQKGTAGIPKPMLSWPTPTCPRAHTHSMPSLLSCHLLTKENRHPKENRYPCPALSARGAASAACLLARGQPDGRGTPVQFPECSLPFLGGHHSLVMFALMSYMLISHGPSPPLTDGSVG